MQYLSIGALITVIALILAFSQFIRPITNFRLNLGWFNLKFAGILFCVAFTATFTAGVLQLIPAKHALLALISDWLQICSGFIILITSSTIIYKSFRYAKFTKSSCEKFFNGCYTIVAYSKEKDLLELAEELGPNISRIISAIKKHDLNKNTSREEKCAFSLLALLSDEVLCKLMARHNPRTTFNVFQTFVENILAIPKHCGYQFIKQLMLQLLIQPNSILNRETEYSGLGIFEGIKHLIFSNLNFVLSDYRPLQIFGPIPTSYPTIKIAAWQVEKYYELFSIALAAYLKEKKQENPMIFLPPFSTLKEIIQANNNAIYYIQESHLTDSPQYSTLLQCCMFIGRLIWFMIDGKNIFPSDNTKIDHENYNVYKNDATLYGALSQGIYDIIESLSTTKHGRQMLRTTLLELYDFNKDDDTIKAIMRRLDILLQYKIEQNLQHHLYPAVANTIIIAFGLCEPEKSNISIHKHLLAELKKHFTASFAKNETIAMDMLPEDTIYVKGTNQLIRTVEYARGRNRVEKLLLQ